MSSVHEIATRAQFREAYRASIKRARLDIQIPAIARTAEQRRRLGAAVPLGEAIGKLASGK